MANFAYDLSRSFRAWLKTLTHRAWHDLASERKRAGVGSGDSRMGEFFVSLEAGDDLVPARGTPRLESLYFMIFFLAEAEVVLYS
jgi:hypothetical protein